MPADTDMPKILTLDVKGNIPFTGWAVVKVQFDRSGWNCLIYTESKSLFLQFVVTRDLRNWYKANGYPLKVFRYANVADGKVHVHLDERVRDGEKWD